MMMITMAKTTIIVLMIMIKIMSIIILALVIPSVALS